MKTEEEVWRMIRRHKPGKRHGHVAVVADNKMWIHGGMRGLMALSDLWNFSFGTNTWTKVRWLGVAPALSNHTAHVVGRSIFMFGGSKCGSLSEDIWIFKIDTLTWRLVTTQNGDVCPPISLHASVLLSTQQAQSANTDRTQSVPQLKRKTTTELNLVRPWTSPIVNSTEIPSLTSSHEVNILHLATLTMDGNNNTHEGIHSSLQNGKYMAETSFCSPDHFHTSHHPSMNQKSSGNSTTVMDTNCLQLGSSSHFGSITKAELKNLTPASAENCSDAVPLLSRFQSVTSDVDLGENNLTMTLSDEEIFGADLCDKSGLRYNNCNLYYDVNKPGNKYSSDLGECVSNIYLKESLIQQTSVKIELHESSITEKDIQSIHFGNLNNSILLKSGLINEHECLSKRHIQKENSNNISSNGINNPGQQDVLCFSPYFQNMFESCGKVDALFRDLTDDYLFAKGNLWDRQLKTKCVSDLTIEDLESCDISELFQNIQMPCPPRPYLRSCSLKELYSCANDFQNNAELNLTCFGLTKNQLTKSCGNLLSQCSSSNFYDNKFTDCKPPIEKKKSKNYYSELQLQKENSVLKNHAISGKYAKHFGPVSRRNRPNISKSFDGLNKSPHVSKISIGTQTTDSKSSLADSKSQQMFEDNPCKVDYLVDHTATSNLQNQQSVQLQSKPVTTANSLFSGGKLCILIIGGQTESHSFQIEPLKMWICWLH